MGIDILWPAIGCDILMFHIRPIAPAGGLNRKNTWNETGWAEYIGCNASATP